MASTSGACEKCGRTDHPHVCGAIPLAPITDQTEFVTVCNVLFVNAEKHGIVVDCHANRADALFDRLRELVWQCDEQERHYAGFADLCKRNDAYSAALSRARQLLGDE